MAWSALFGHPEVGGPVWVPQGAAAFADVVVSYSPVLDWNDPDGIWGNGDEFQVPVPAYRNAGDALGPADYDGHVFGAPYDTGEFVSLGNGGDLVLQFTDVLLSPNGDSGYDLYVFEAGDLAEAVDVWISKTGNLNSPADWYYVGQAAGGIAGIDIDDEATANGWTTADQFAYVWLKDVHGHELHYSIWSGADIDAVAVVPEPSALAVVLVGMSFVLIRKVRRR